MRADGPAAGTKVPDQRPYRRARYGEHLVARCGDTEPRTAPRPDVPGQACGGPSETPGLSPFTQPRGLGVRQGGHLPDRPATLIGGLGHRAGPAGPRPMLTADALVGVPASDLVPVRTYSGPDRLPLDVQAEGRAQPESQWAADTRLPSPRIHTPGQGVIDGHQDLARAESPGLPGPWCMAGSNRRGTS